MARFLRKERPDVSMEESVPSHSSFCTRNSFSHRCSWERVIEKRSQSLSTVDRRRKYPARTRRMKNRP